MTTTPPQRSKDLLREEEVSDGINLIVDDRLCCLFPMECRAQVDHLVESVNRAFRQRMTTAYD